MTHHRRSIDRQTEGKGVARRKRKRRRRGGEEAEHFFCATAQTQQRQ
jgi:hypothetical protein